MMEFAMPAAGEPSLEIQFPENLLAFANMLFSKELRMDDSLTTPEMRRRKASEVTGYAIPDPPLSGQDPSQEYAMMVVALSDALKAQSDIDYATMQTREVALYNMLETMMFPPDGDSLKAVETMGKCDAAIEAMLTRLKKQYDELAMGDERLKKAIADGNYQRRRSISPEKR